MRIFICGLYRSGTTITWKTISQDPDFVSFDEPFNENLRDLPRLNRSGSNANYLPRFEKEPSIFREYFAPILPSEDLNRAFTHQQEKYLLNLLTPYKNLNVDFTRCTFKLANLHQLFPDALIIHLKRKPSAFASSHLIPTYKAKGIKAALGRIYRSKTVFTRKSRYNFYNYEQIIEQHAPQEFEHLLPLLKEYQGLELKDLPAFVKLLLLHKRNQEVVNEFAAKHGENFLEWQFEDFLEAPEKHLREVYKYFNKPMFSFDFSKFRSANLGYSPTSKMWDVFLE